MARLRDFYPASSLEGGSEAIPIADVVANDFAVDGDNLVITDADLAAEVEVGDIVQVTVDGTLYDVTVESIVGDDVTVSVGDAVASDVLAAINAATEIVTVVAAVDAEFVGNVTGDVTGGDISGVFTGDITGDVEGDVIGDVVGDLTGNVTGDLNGTAEDALALLITDNDDTLTGPKKVLYILEGDYDPATATNDTLYLIHE